jgi:hypothetical protein
MGVEPGQTHLVAASYRYRTVFARTRSSWSSQGIIEETQSSADFHKGSIMQREISPGLLAITTAAVAGALIGPSLVAAQQPHPAAVGDLMTAE